MNKPDPFNLGPVDPDWVKRCDAATTQAAAALGHPVVMIPIQPEGKIGMCTAGFPDDGPLADMLADLPQFFLMMAAVCMKQDALGIKREEFR